MKDRMKFRFYNNGIMKNFSVLLEDLIQTPHLDENNIHLWHDVRKNDYSPMIMQCVGIKDKNNKLIYEGDILKDCSNHIRVCVYEYDTYKFPALKTSRYFHKAITNKKPNRRTGILARLSFQDNLSRKDKNSLEVIGNIYENPELLEGKI